MDPVAHTLLGATLAETGLKKLSRYALPALLIGANLPDIDVVAGLWGSDSALLFRRGWTHGILALLVLPLLLAGILWAWHKWRAPPEASPPLHLPWLIGLCFIGVWSHPLLDWLNTYGIRLLMPFSDRWFYGDTLFIIDPWFWLLSAAGVVLAYSHTQKAIVGWSLLAGLSTTLILSASQVALMVKGMWLAGILLIVLLRFRERLAAQHVARVGLVALLGYGVTMYGLARLAEFRAAASGEQPLQAQANPLPGLPLSHRVVLMHEDHYRVVAANGDVVDVPRQSPDAVVQFALRSKTIRGFTHWMRFPYWEVEETPKGWLVTFKDLRYVDPQAASHSENTIGVVQVEVLREQVQLPQGG